MPLGDDVLTQFTNGTSQYLTTSSGVGEKISNISEYFNSVKFYYLNWGGRIVGVMLFPLLSIIGHFGIALIIASIYTYVILVTYAIIFDNSLQLLKNPFILLVLNITIFYSNPSISYLVMWTFTSIYVVAYALLITYIYLTKKGDHGVDEGVKILWTIFGFICGITHEVFGLLTLVFIFFIHKSPKNFLDKLKKHIGILMGVGLCILAPGNFTRLNSAHDLVPNSRSFYVKLIENITAHAHVISGTPKRVSLIILFCGFLITFFCLIKNNNNFNKALSITINYFKEYLVFLITMISIWIVFPYTPIYGTFYFLCFSTIIIIRYNYLFGNDKNEVQKQITIAFTYLILIYLFLINYSWIKSMSNITQQRRAIISEAIANKERYAIVPPYLDQYSNRFNFYNYNNFSNQENKSVYYEKYYGVILELDNFEKK
jgi:hypothetical protein